MTSSRGTRVTVRPAGAERETLFVALLCLAIVLAAGAVIGLRTRAPDVTGIAAWQIDARDGLTAAEQGLNADLKVAADEIVFALDGGAAPTPENLAEDELPPFARDAATAGRGGHVWSLVPTADGFAGWFGRSAASEVAGSLILRIAIPEDGHAHGADDRVSIWLNRAPGASVAGLSNEALVAAGWREIVSRYDASVTRGTGQ